MSSFLLGVSPGTPAHVHQEIIKAFTAALFELTKNKIIQMSIERKNG